MSIPFPTVNSINRYYENYTYGSLINQQVSKEEKRRGGGWEGRGLGKIINRDVNW